MNFKKKTIREKHSDYYQFCKPVHHFRSKSETATDLISFAKVI